MKCHTEILHNSEWRNPQTDRGLRPSKMGVTTQVSTDTGCIQSTTGQARSQRIQSHISANEKDTDRNVKHPSTSNHQIRLTNWAFMERRGSFESVSPIRWAFLGSAKCLPHQGSCRNPISQPVQGTTTPVAGQTWITSGAKKPNPHSCRASLSKVCGK